MNKEREEAIREERGRRRVKRYLAQLYEHWPALAAASMSVLGAGALFFFLKRRTKEKDTIDKIVEEILSDPEELRTISQKLGPAAIIPVAERLSKELDKLPEPERSKVFQVLQEAARLAEVPPGAVTPEDQIISASTRIASEIAELQEGRTEEIPTTQSKPQDN